MGNKNTLDMGRRALLGGLGACAGLLIASDGLPSWLAGSRLDGLSYNETLNLLDASLTPAQRDLVVLPWNDPSRQLTNTIAIYKGPHIGTLFDVRQVALIRQLYKTMLSKQGHDWFRNTTALEGKFEGSIFRLYSDAGAGSLANSDKTISMINGGHYMLRHGESLSSDNSYVFGGPISYGQQLGNNAFKVEGNAFKAHGDAVNDFHSSLSASERAQAYQLLPPMELITQIQGPGGKFPGLRLGDSSVPAQELAQEMLATIFASYPVAKQREVFSAIEENGGLESLHIALYQDYSFYQDGMRLADLSAEQRALRDHPYTQVWRIEGPACVIHFQGYPHVHAYINVVRDPARVAIGEVLINEQSGIRGEAVRDALQAALRYQTGEPLAYFPMPPAGILPPGPVSTGSLYALDPFDNHAVVLEIDESAMTEKLKKSLLAQGVQLGSAKRFRLAAPSYLLEDSRDLGGVERVVFDGGSIRDSLIELVRRDPGVLRG